MTCEISHISQHFSLGLFSIYCVVCTKVGFLSELITGNVIGFFIWAISYKRFPIKFALVEWEIRAFRTYIVVVLLDLGGSRSWFYRRRALY